MYFLWAGLSDDPTATGSAGSAVAWLVGIVVVIGAVLGTIGWPRRTICWAARRCHRGRARVMEVRGGLFKRLSDKVVGSELEPLVLPGGKTVQVVGESYYQDALDVICGGKCEEGHHLM